MYICVWSGHQHWMLPIHLPLLQQHGNPNSSRGPSQTWLSKKLWFNVAFSKNNFRVIFHRVCVIFGILSMPCVGCNQHALRCSVHSSANTRPTCRWLACNGCITTSTTSVCRQSCWFWSKTTTISLRATKVLFSFSIPDSVLFPSAIELTDVGLLQMEHSYVILAIPSLFWPVYGLWREISRHCLPSSILVWFVFNLHIKLNNSVNSLPNDMNLGYNT